MARRLPVAASAQGRWSPAPSDVRSRSTTSTRATRRPAQRCKSGPAFRVLGKDRLSGRGNGREKDQCFIIDDGLMPPPWPMPRQILESRKATVVQRESISNADVGPASHTRRLAGTGGAWTKAASWSPRPGITPPARPTGLAGAGPTDLDFTENSRTDRRSHRRHMVNVGDLVMADAALLTTLYQWDAIGPVLRYRKSTISNTSSASDEKLRKMPPEAASKGKAGVVAADEGEKRGKSTCSVGGGNARSGRSQPSQMRPATRAPGLCRFAEPTVEAISGTLLIRGVFANPEPYVLRPGFS